MASRVLSNEEFESWRERNGYKVARQLDDGTVLALQPLTFQRWRLNVGDLGSVEQFY